jgi:SAM-dependent methyltransferase
MSKTLRSVKNFLVYFLAAFGYKRLVFNQARNAARRTGKPLLNAGCGSAYTELSDVNLDIVTKKVENFVHGDIQNLGMFREKQFGAVYASHVVEHVEDLDAALAELHRVADHVFIITPFPLWPWAWLWPDHKWVLWEGKKVAGTPYNLIKKVTRKVTANKSIDSAA